MRCRNAIGWGEWSPTAWLSTIPDVPEPPPAPNCSAERSTHISLAVQLTEPDPNGQDVTAYQLNVSRVSDGALLYSHVLANDGGGCAALERNVSAEEVLGYAFSVLGLNETIEPASEYRVVVRARNALGWSEWSDAGAACRTADDPGPGANMAWLIPLLVSLLVLLLLTLCFIFIFWCTDVPKIIAPRLRRVEEKEDPLEDFIVKEDTPMQDFDPDLKLNPVLLAKLEVERQKAAQKKGKGQTGPVWRGGPGALARLNWSIKEKGKESEGPQKANMKTIDVMLQRQNAAQPKTGNEKEITRRALTMNSKAKEKRMRSRAADRMVHDAEQQTCAAKKRAIARAAQRMSAVQRMQGIDEGGSSESII